ncbi:MAG: TDP-N-acetylfucosamine:lipid II N-acetylfucosaminyltransferase [Bacteroidaceae bacterium]|nr:TDP-N-acetylfucosamine:lipid II N-acetylfucosaminyltransferase [Bacteroidaceae bacterium]
MKIFRDELPDQNIVLIFNHFGYQVDGDAVVTDKNAGDIAQQIDFSCVSYVIVSFLTGKKISFIKKYVPKHIPVIWWTYGVDLYMTFLEKRGFRVFYSNPDRYRFLGIFSLPLIRLLRLMQNKHIRDVQNEFISDRLFGFVPCIVPEFDLLQSYIDKKIELIRIHPFGASFKFEGRFSQGNDIALGHSASISDNHLYALKYLRQLHLGESNLYLTLSYSNKVPKYTEEVKRKFKKAFGNQVRFIETFMDKPDYLESQFRYKMMILPSWRQEALDNIYTCLQIGIKLVLSDRSIVYQYLKEYGFIVFSIEQLTQIELERPFDLIEKQHNQQLFVRFIEERKSNYYSDFNGYFKK